MVYSVLGAFLRNGALIKSFFNNYVFIFYFFLYFREISKYI